MTVAFMVPTHLAPINIDVDCCEVLPTIQDDSTPYADNEPCSPTCFLNRVPPSPPSQLISPVPRDATHPRPRDLVDGRSLPPRSSSSHPGPRRKNLLSHLTRSPPFVRTNLLPPALKKPLAPPSHTNPYGTRTLPSILLLTAFPFRIGRFL